MKNIKRSSSVVTPPCVDRSLVVECEKSNVVPMYPGWPPAELPPREYGLRHVGQPHQVAHDTEDEN
jgi:hypothetical protein